MVREPLIAPMCVQRGFIVRDDSVAQQLPQFRR
jgi:hypothetical protein